MSPQAATAISTQVPRRLAAAHIRANTRKNCLLFVSHLELNVLLPELADLLLELLDLLHRLPHVAAVTVAKVLQTAGLVVKWRPRFTFVRGVKANTISCPFGMVIIPLCKKKYAKRNANPAAFTLSMPEYGEVLIVLNRIWKKAAGYLL